MLLLLGSSSGWAGMAELGRRRNLTGGPESFGTDVANGGASVILSADGHRFGVNTFPGQTVDLILEALETQVNLSGFDLVATHVAASPEITVTRGLGGEVAQLGLQTTDTGFGHVDITRTNAGMVSVAGVSLAPVGDGNVTIFVDGNVAATVSTLPFIGNANALNQELLAQLLAGGCDATLGGDGILRILRNNLGQRILSVGWEDTDGEFLDGVAPLVLARGQDVAGLPSAGTWGMILLSLLLMGSLTLILRRRQRAGQAGKR